jgi:hypothetical protein
MAAALCRLGYHDLRSTRGANVDKRAMSPPTVYLNGTCRKFRISWAFVLFRSISTGLSTGLSTEFIDGLSKLP